MRTHSSKGRAFAALLIAAIAVFGLATTAQAKLTGNYTKFAQCPYSNLEVKKCVLSTTKGGEVVLGSKKVPIVNPVVLQGGAGKQVEGIAPFFAASNGITLSKSPQPVPGGLAGLINCKEISEPFLRFSCELTFENGLTGLNSTLELAKPASEIRISENNLAAEEGVALKMPVKVHLENPFLGSNCYVGSSSSPLIWNLTTGKTAPPGPNTPISGKAGFIEFLEEGSIALAQRSHPGRQRLVCPRCLGLRRLPGRTDPQPDHQLGRSACRQPRVRTPRSSKTKSTSPPLPRCGSTTRKTPRAQV